MAKILKLKIPTMELVDATNISYDVPDLFHLTKHTIFNSTIIDKLKAQYTNYDVFQHMIGTIDSPIHYHNDFEIRVIIRGNPTFYILSNEFLYVIECASLDQLELAPNVLHWFKASSELLVYRFFSKNTSHVMHVPEYITQDMINAKSYIDNHGLKLNYSI